MSDQMPTCSVDGCTYLATQGRTCLKHRPAAAPLIARPEWADHIKRVVDAAPPLSRAQRDKIAVLLAKSRGALQ